MTSPLQNTCAKQLTYSSTDGDYTHYRCSNEQISLAPINYHRENETARLFSEVTELPYSTAVLHEYCSNILADNKTKRKGLHTVRMCDSAYDRNSSPVTWLADNGHYEHCWHYRPIEDQRETRLVTQTLQLIKNH